MKKILMLLTITFSSFVICMTPPEVTGDVLELFKAIENKDVNKVRALLEEGVNFKTKQIYNKEKISPFAFALKKDPDGIFKTMEAFQAYGQSAIFFGAIKDDLGGSNIPKIRKIIINFGIKNIDDRKDGNGDTALMWAVRNDNIALISFLIGLKADINIQNIAEDSALTLALKSGQELLVNRLLENAYNIAIDKSYKDGNTPLMLAVATDNPNIVAKIVAEVPDPHKENSKGKTAYDFVSTTEAGLEIAKLLINAAKQYKLHEAIYSKNFDAIEKSDAQLNIESVERNPLVVAIGTVDQKTVEAIVNKGANVNQLLRGNKTPLWQTVEKINVGILDFLLAKGAKPNIADIYDQYTPIFEVARINRKLAVESLIKNGASVNYQATSLFPGVSGKVTPLMLAAENLGFESVEILLNAGADPLMKNSEGKTALDIAQKGRDTTNLVTSKQTYQKIITLLEEKMKTIPPTTKPSTPVTSDQLISLLQNLTQQLNGLSTVLQKN